MNYGTQMIIKTKEIKGIEQAKENDLLLYEILADAIDNAAKALCWTFDEQGDWPEEISIIFKTKKSIQEGKKLLKGKV